MWNAPRDVSTGARWLWAGVLRTRLQSGSSRGGAALFLQVFVVLLGPLPAVQEHGHHSHLQSVKQLKQNQDEWAEPQHTNKKARRNVKHLKCNNEQIFNCNFGTKHYQCLNDYFFGVTILVGYKSCTAENAPKFEMVPHLLDGLLCGSL